MTADAEKQGHYTPAEDMRAFITGYNQSVVDGIMGVKTKVDPNGNLPPLLRKQIDDYLRSVATAAHAKAAQFVKDFHAGTEQAGVGRAR